MLTQNLLSIFLTTVFIVLFIFFSLSVKIVPQGEEWTLEHFGRFARIMHPGIHFITPFFDRVGVKVSVREQVLDVPPQDVITKDNAMVTVDGVVFYRVFDSRKAAYMIANLRFAITQLIMTNIRTVVGEMDLDTMLSNREMINGKLLTVVDEATDPWGVKVLRIEIKDIRPPHDLQQAMSRQMKAEREKRALVLEAQGAREAAILKANGQKESAILEAEGHKEAIILQAFAEKERAFLASEGRERQATAEANAIRSVSDAIVKSDQSAAQYFLAQKYIQSLRDMASGTNSKTVFMPFEASNVMSNLGSLGKLAQDIFQERKKK